MAEKFNHEKEKHKKLKELKSWLNFEGCSGTSRYSELKTMSAKEHDKRHVSRRSCSPRTSVFSRIRHERWMSPIRRERSRSPRQRAKEGGVFKRLGSRGKSVPTRSDSYNRHSHSRVWFDDLPPESIDSNDDLKKAFLESYLQQKKYIKDPIELHNIKQRDGESTEDFVRRYKLESRDVKGAPECMRISGFVHEITNPELIKRLRDKIPKTINEMIRVTTSFLRGEVAASNHERKKTFPLWKQHESSQKQNFKKGSFRNQQRSERKQDRFSLLTKTPKEIFALDKGKFKAPPPMTTPVEKRNHEKFCDFHGEVGHNTHECMHLRKQIAEMLKAGKLSHLIKEIKQTNGKEQPKVTKKGETSGKDKAEDEETEFPMIIESEIGGHHVHRMYVDSGSASKIMYEHCFNRLRSKIKKQLIPATTPLIGFRGEIIWPIGQIQLLVKIGDEEHSALAWMNFMVVRSQNVGATYRRLVDKAFHKHISRNLKVYVDDLVIKCRTEDEIVRDVEETFKTLREINIKLNPKKCAFGVEEGMFLGYKVNAKGLKVCPDKEAEEAFKQMKQLIVELLMLTAPMEKEELIVYLAVAKETVSAVLMTEREAKHMPIYFVSRALRGPELNYTSMKKLVLALVHASKRLMRPRISVKGHILADFIVKRTKEDSSDTAMEEEVKLPEPWILFTDGSSCIDDSRSGLILTNPEGMEFTYALRFRFGLPGEIISDNEKQFWDDPFKDWWEKLCIRQHFASVKHPQTNGLVERANCILGEGIKARLDARSKNWIEELPHVLWAHHKMIKSSNEDTPFSLTYETKAVISAELGMPTLRTMKVDLVGNNEALKINLDLLEEWREEATIRDLVYRNNDASRVEDTGKLGPKWEGPYEVTEALGKGKAAFADLEYQQP
nr:reverse transcriptase domain-containing protein [Tanacetum cinerariifolium]